MDKHVFFDRNLLALSQLDPALCTRLSTSETTRGRYRFIQARSGEIVPALVDASGAAHPLHSLVDPRKEGERLIAAGGDEGFLVFLGLGGGFSITAALERERTGLILAIDYDIHGIAELLTAREYITLFSDPRFHLLVDPSPGVIEEALAALYLPAIHGGIRTIPLRIRAAEDQGRFDAAAAAVKSAVESVSADYSVQAHFGKRWFSNIIRNLKAAEENYPPIPPIGDAAICAAGPSLDVQIPALAEKRGSLFLLAADTALPALLAAGLTPDAVISIDCQHISYYHFMAGLPQGIPLFLDLASPPALSSLPGEKRFFSGAHPLAGYVSRRWRPFPVVDTSGGNVTYAAFCLAEKLGARSISLWGADFSYPMGRTYSRGTYIYPYFENRQNRLHPLENLHSAFLCRSPLSKEFSKRGFWYYETQVLSRYRMFLEARIPKSPVPVNAVPGLGAEMRIIPGKPRESPASIRPLFSAGRAETSSASFLESYRARIHSLPAPPKRLWEYFATLGEEGRMILATMLPAAAQIRKRNAALSGCEILEETRTFCLEELDRVIRVQ